MKPEIFGPTTLLTHSLTNHSDVYIADPVDTQVLQYVVATGKWSNSFLDAPEIPPAGVNGYVVTTSGGATVWAAIPAQKLISGGADLPYANGAAVVSAIGAQPLNSNLTEFAALADSNGYLKNTAGVLSWGAVATELYTGGATLPYANINAVLLALAGGTAVTSTELSYIDGLTSAAQTQIDGKQPLNAKLTSIAALANASGGLTNNGSGTFSYVTYQASNANLTTLAAISPTKGRMLVGNGTDWIAFPVGTDTHTIVADSTQTAGIKWAAASGGGLSWTSPTTNALGKYSGGAIVNSSITDTGTDITLANTGKLNFGSGTFSTTGRWISGYGSGSSLSLGATDNIILYAGGGSVPAHFNGTGLGINVAPSTLLHIRGSAGATAVQWDYDASNYARWAIATGGIPTLTTTGAKLNLVTTALKFSGTTALPASTEFGIGLDLDGSNFDGLIYQAPSGYAHQFKVTTSAVMQVGDGSNNPYVGIGGSFTPTAPLHARATSGNQLLLDYSSGVNAGFAVSSAGNLTITPSGSYTALGAGYLNLDTAGSVTTAVHGIGLVGGTGMRIQVPDTYDHRFYGGSAYLRLLMSSTEAQISSSTNVTALLANSSERIKINSTGIGFFGVTPAARASAYTQTYSTASKTVPAALTDSTTGTPGTTLADVGAVPTQANINNNFASLNARLLIAMQLINALIDDDQAYGLKQ